MRCEVGTVRCSAAEWESYLAEMLLVAVCSPDEELRASLLTIPRVLVRLATVLTAVGGVSQTCRNL